MPSTLKKTNYRPDIDGLRAVAVLSVILFHIDKNLLPGGFVGVDIFFVISGYLISLHIFQELEIGQFSIVEFYRRRIKRIAPPMLLVVFLTLVIAQFILIPEDAERVAESALWSLLSLANVYFWLYQDTSYFAAASSELPLLHLWSLGVEEQFYILWPLLLMLVYRKLSAKALMVFVAGTALASFMFGQLGYAHAPSFVYYMLPTRAGELLIGAAIAFATLNGIEQRLPEKATQLIALTGLSLVIASLLLLTEEMTFPGYLAIPPTLGAALLILAGHDAKGWIPGFLALKPVVWIGQVSYSAYLWHWPIIAFYRYGHAEIGIVPGASILALTFFLAWISYLLIESPARASKASAIRIFFTQYAIPTTIIGVLAVGAMLIDGYGLRWKSEDYLARLNGFRDQTRPAYQFDYVCQRQKINVADTQNERCVTGADTSSGPRVILWGDSNAAHYVGTISAIAQKAGFRLRNIELGSCPPLLSDPAPYVVAKRLADCRSSAPAIAEAINTSDVVIISATWPDYQKRSDRFLSDFFSTVRSLSESGKMVILLGKAPIIAGYDRRCREKALSYPMLDCPPSSAIANSEVSMVNEQIRRFSEATANVAFFDVTPYLCKENTCSAFGSDGSPLYYDQSHLSLPGSWKVGEMILQRDGVPKPFSMVTSSQVH